MNAILTGTRTTRKRMNHQRALNEQDSPDWLSVALSHKDDYSHPYGWPKRVQRYERSVPRVVQLPEKRGRLTPPAKRLVSIATLPI
jgi:hypothetical protein